MGQHRILADQATKPRVSGAPPPWFENMGYEVYIYKAMYNHFFGLYSHIQTDAHQDSFGVPTAMIRFIIRSN